MNRIASLFLALFLALGLISTVYAQTPESIWLSAGTTAFKPADTFTASVNVISGTPIQGFNIQLRYDPACLQPTETITPMPGMNLLALPQTDGLVDATFAGSTPQVPNGVLVDVHFTALAECQTSLTLEKADLAVKNAEGFAVPVVGLTMGQQTVQISVGPGAPVTPVPTGGAAPSPALPISAWVIALLVVLGILIAFVIVKLVRSMPGGPGGSGNSKP